MVVLTDPFSFFSPSNASSEQTVHRSQSENESTLKVDKLTTKKTCLSNRNRDAQQPKPLRRADRGQRTLQLRRARTRTTRHHRYTQPQQTKMPRVHIGLSSVHRRLTTRESGGGGRVGGGGGIEGRWWWEKRRENSLGSEELSSDC